MDSCLPNPCYKSGNCTVHNKHIPCNISCAFLQDLFYGNRCNFTDSLEEAKTLAWNTTFNQTEDVINVLKTAKSQMVISSGNLSVVVNSAAAISLLAQKFSKTPMNASTSAVITQGLLNATGVLFEVFASSSCANLNSSLCEKNQTLGLINQIQDTIFAIADAIILNTNGSNINTTVETPSIKLTVISTNNTSSIAGKEFSTSEMSITFPPSLKDIITDGISLLISVLNPVFSSTRAPPNLNISGNAFLCRIVDSTGKKVMIDSSDPISLEFGANPDIEQQPIQNDTLLKVVFTDYYESTFVARFFADGDYWAFTLTGRFDMAPTDKTYDFRAHIVRGQAQLFTKPNSQVDLDFQTGVLNVVVIQASKQGNYLFMTTSFEDTAPTFSRRRLLQVSPSLSMSSRTVCASYWDAECACWSTSNEVQITKVRSNGRVKFTTNFLGAFSLSEIIIAPEMIDFSSLFLNFDDKLADSPYVLILNCVILTLTVAVTIILRQIDIRDLSQWAYLPLLGNEESDQWHYAVSIQTSMRSQRRLNGIPSLSVIGQYGQSRAVGLCDGIREHFKRGTTSNFIMSSSKHLGPLMEIKIWLATDDDGETPIYIPQHNKDCQFDTIPEGVDGSPTQEMWTPKLEKDENCNQKSCSSRFQCCCCRRGDDAKIKEELPYWKLGHVTIMDLTTNDRYTFLCQDWLSKTHGDGRTMRHIPVLDSKLADSGTLFEVISKRNLCDQHLWLSIVTRPSYSIFTRVQRFLVAVSFLYLAMITNAMWYRDSKSEDQDSNATNGITIGMIHITYRTFYVGVVSSFIMIVPGIIMTCMFRNRKHKFFHGQRIYPARHKPMVSLPLTPTEGCSKPTTSMNPDIEYERLFALKLRGLSQLTCHKSQFDNKPISAVGIQSRCQSKNGTQTETQTPLRQLIQGDFYDFSRLLKPHKKIKKMNGNTMPPLFPFVTSSSYPSSADAYLYSDTIQVYDSWNSLIYSERKRLGIDVVREDAQRKTCLLPWWSIFIGYTLIIASILASAAFTFFYSLQWGGALSLEWMASLFFSTTTGTFCIEPIKIVLVSLVLSCLLRGSAHDQLSEIAPVDPCYEVAAPLELKEKWLSSPLREPDEGATHGKPSTDLMKQRKQLKLKERLFSVIRGITFQAVFVVLVGIICLHADVTMTFYQNQVLINELELTDGIDQNISNYNDFYIWLKKTAVPKLLPKYHYNKQLLSVYQQRFTSDLQMYRLTPISITQKRVKGNCTAPRVIQNHFYRPVQCHREYDDTTVETQDFLEGWIPCITNCSTSWFTYTSGDQWSLSESGTIASYLPGGYQVLLAQEQSLAMDSVTTLMKLNWLDQQTRAVLTEFAVFNANTRLFTQVKVLAEIPTFGGAITSVEVRSANLYPYTVVSDYLVLLVQLVFVLLFLVRICLIVHLLTCAQLKSEGRTTLGVRVLVEALDLSVSLAAIVAYALRITSTIALLEFINNNPKEFASFDTIFVCDKIYTVCISSVLFMRILGFLGPLAINSQLYIMRQTLMSSRTLLISLGLTMLVVIVSFSFFFHLYNGRSNQNTSSLSKAIITLTISLLGMSNSNDFVDGSVELWQITVQRIMFGIFSAISAVWLLNFSICTLNVSMETVKTEELRALRKLKKSALREPNLNRQPGKRDELDREVGSFALNKLGSLFTSCSSKGQQTPPRNPKAEHVLGEQQLNHSDVQLTLETIIEKLKTCELSSQQPSMKLREDSDLPRYFSNSPLVRKIAGQESCIHN